MGSASYLFRDAVNRDQCEVRAKPSKQEIDEAIDILKAGPVRLVTRGRLFWKRTRKVGAPRHARRVAANTLKRAGYSTKQIARLRSV